MKSGLFPAALLLFLLVSCGKQKLDTQTPPVAAIPALSLAPTDVVLLERMKAVNLTDSMNSYLPDSVRVRVIQYLSDHQMRPAEYYIFYRPKIPVRNGLRYINLSRIGALRQIDYYRQQPKDVNGARTVRVGAAGGPGDDIIVLFDDKLKAVQKIVPAE